MERDQSLESIHSFSDIAVSKEESGASEKDLEVSVMVVERLLSKWGSDLHKVILFGSRARGDSHPDSDFDFLILADFNSDSWRERNILVRRSVGYFGEGVDYVTLKPEEYPSKFLYWRSVEREGVVIYERRNGFLVKKG
jgi:predicted nucleotidyltransferase